MPPAVMPFFEPSGKATRSGAMPGEDGSDAERDELERKHTDLIYRALQRLLRQVAPTGTTVDNITPDDAVRRYRDHESILRDAMVAMLTDGAMLGADVGRAQTEWLMGVGKAATVVGVDWDLINEDVLQWVMGGGAFGGGFGQGYADAVTQVMATTTERQLRTLVGEWIRNDLTYRQLVDDLSRTVFSRSRAEMIATTEITAAYSRGTLAALRRSPIPLQKRYYAANDERMCPRCGAAHGRIDDLDGDFGGYGDPPLHPRCRCYIHGVPAEENRSSGEPRASQPEPSIEPVTQPEPVYKLRYKPDQRQVERVLNGVNQRIQNLANRTGYDVEEIEQSISRLFDKLTMNNPIAINFHSRNIDALLEDGRIKSQFETGTSGAILNKNARLNSEELGLGVPERARAQNRPIYGFLRISRQAEEIGYGDITFVLKDNVKNKSTITAGDSLYDFAGGVTVGTPVTKPGKGSWGNYVSELFDFDSGMITEADLLRRMNYFEVQIQGGAKLSDISHVIDRKGALSSDQIRRLNEAGVQVWNSD